MIYEMIRGEFASLGADFRICHRLVSMRQLPYLSWLLHRIVERDDKSRGIVEALETFVAYCGDDRITFSKVKYAYFEFNIAPLCELEKRPEYGRVRDELRFIVDSSKFWDSVLPFNYNHARRLAAERMFGRGDNPRDVACMLSVSYRQAYYWRHSYFNTRYKSRWEEFTTIKRR